MIGGPPGWIVRHDTEQVDKEPVAAEILHPHAPVSAHAHIFNPIRNLINATLVRINNTFSELKPSSCSQCCGSGSGAFLTPGSGMGKKIRIRIRDEQTGSHFRELRNTFLGLKYLNSFTSIQDGKKLDPG
jgi:hypothetical protein